MKEVREKIVRFIADFVTKYLIKASNTASDVLEKAQSLSDINRYTEELQKFCFLYGFTEVVISFLEYLCDDDSILKEKNYENFKWNWFSLIVNYAALISIPMGPFYEWITNRPKELGNLKGFKKWGKNWIERLNEKRENLKFALSKEISIEEVPKFKNIMVVGGGNCLLNLLFEVDFIKKSIREQKLNFCVIDFNTTHEEHATRENLKKKFKGFSNVKFLKFDNPEDISGKELTPYYSEKTALLIPSTFWFSRGIMVRKSTSQFIEQFKENSQQCVVFGCIGGFKHYINHQIKVKNKVGSLDVVDTVKDEEIEQRIKKLKCAKLKFEVLVYRLIDYLLVT